MESKKEGKAKSLKYHSMPIFFLVIITLIYFSSFLFQQGIPLDDYTTYYIGRAELVKQSFKDYNNWISLWNPYLMSGMPFLAQAGTQGQFYILGALIMLLPNVVLALKLNYVFDFFLAGLFMYIFVFYLTKNRTASLASSLVYTLNGWVASRYLYAHLTTMNAYVFMPILFLFIFKIFRRRKNWIRNTVILGILFALQIHSGPDLKVFLLTALAFGIFLLFYMIGKNLKARLTKAAIVGIIIMLIAFGLTAIKTLPEREYLELTGRLHLPYDLAAKRAVKTPELFTRLVEPVTYEGFPQVRWENKQKEPLNIGIFAFLLCILAVYKRYRNKTVLFFSTLSVLGILIANGTFVHYLLWRFVPLFSGLRYLDRTVSLFIFGASILTAFGLIELTKYLKSGFSLSEKKLKISQLVIILLIFINLFVFGYKVYYPGMKDPYEIIDNVEILNYIKEQPGIFRTHINENKGIDWGTDSFTIPLKLETLYAYEGTWLQEYMNEYLSIAFNNPAKFWGIINVKYLTSTEQLNMTGFRFVKKFNNCSICWPQEVMNKVWGPYLYENLLFLPRSYFVQDAVLVIGEKQNSKQIMYALMLDSKFNPSKTAIILSEKDIKQYSTAELSRFKAVILAGSQIDSNVMNMLKNYKDNDGILIPDLIKGENTITENSINGLFQNFNKNIIPVDDSSIKRPDFDNININIENKNGFLIVSEQFSMYPGWKASVNNKNLEILRANGVISAVYIPKGTEGLTISFQYKPYSYSVGKFFSLMTIILLMVYFAYYFYSKNSVSKAINPK